MCKIGQFCLVQPDGGREEREQLLVCAQRTFNKPCKAVEVVRLPDRLVDSDLTLHSSEREPRGRQIRKPRPVPVLGRHDSNEPSEEDEEGSSSLPEATHKHIRSRSLSPLTRYGIEKDNIRLRELGERELRERELRERERWARIRREDREARERAAILERLEWETDIRRARQEARVRERLAAEREAIHEQEQLDRERARMQREREDLERLRAARARQLHQDRAQILREEEEVKRHKARQLREERDRSRYAEQRFRNIQPRIIPIEPRDLGSPRRHSNSSVTLNFKFWNLFSSKKLDGKEKRRYHVVRDRNRPQHRESTADSREQAIPGAITQTNPKDFERRTLHEGNEEVAEETLKLLERKLQPSDLRPDPQLHEVLPKHENVANDDLASLLSVQSFADSGYESQIMHSDHFEFQEGADQLISLLLSDSELQNLFEEAFQRSKARGRFVSKFRMLLKIYGAELRKEAINASTEAAADLVQTKATYVATKIKKAYETGVSETRDETRSAKLEALLQRRYDPSSDDDTEAEKSHEGAKLAPISLEGLKVFMTTSKAFANMRNAFRRMVYPDPLTAISNTVYREHKSTKLHSTPESSSATFHVHWDVGDYISTELGYHSKLHERGQLLESVVVVVGSVSTAYATSAINYMRWRWPESDHDMLKIVHSKLTGTSYVSADRKDGLDKPRIIPTLLENAEVSFLVTGSLEQIIVVAQQLAWITATFRVPVYGQVSYSEVLISRVGDMIFDLFPTPLEEVRERAGACWLPLFTNSIIARGHAIPAREGEMGIEIPFALMTALANVMYPVFHNDGIYLRGFSNLLFPASISPDMKSIQWHLTTSTTAKSHLPHGTLPATTNEIKWAKCDDFEQLTLAPRTFPGCYRQIYVELGTGNSTETAPEITYSNADNEKPAAGMMLKSATTGFAGMGFWNAQVNMELVLPKGLMSTKGSGWYLDMLDLAKDTPMIVYDNAKTAKRACLIPQLSVVLHMAHVWARDRTDLLRPIPTAAPHWDSGEAALSVIKRHSKDELRDGLEKNETYRLSDLIGRLLRTLHKIAETEDLARHETSGIVKFGGSKLCGWELLDVVRGEDIISRKQVDLSQEWMVLGEESIVLFCQNFGDVIKPAPNIKLCPMAQSVNQGQNQLTATIKCLQRLSEKRCGSKDSACLRIANQAYWLSPGGELFKDCTHGTGDSHTRTTECEKLPQQILKGYVNPIRHETPPIQGAVTFGKRRLRRPIATAQTAFPLRDHKIPLITWAAIKARIMSIPQVTAVLANPNDKAFDNTTGDAHNNTNGVILSKTVSTLHQRKSTLSSLISRITAELREKGEKRPTSPLHNDLPWQPEAGHDADLRVESNRFKQPHRTRTASVTREPFREPLTRHLGPNQEERPVLIKRGINNTRVRQTRGASVARGQLHRPTSHPSRASLAHHSLHHPTSDLSVLKLEERSKRDVQPIMDKENSQETEERRVLCSLYEPPPVEHILRRSVRRSNIAYTKNRSFYLEEEV